jgi:hypothetical protein
MCPDLPGMCGRMSKNGSLDQITAVSGYLFTPVPKNSTSKLFHIVVNNIS